ncbi:MAG: acyltransferase family protein [Magnetospiraceae bacterium]
MTHSAPPTSQNHIASIDGMRAIAVLSVILFHFNEHILPGGFVGVDIFFVISGYVITKSLYSRPYNHFFDYIGNFYKRRFLRIGPALFLCLSVTALFASMFVVPSWLGSSNEQTGLSAYFGLSNFFLLENSDGYFNERVEFNPFTHTWSLAVEEQFYLIFPILLFFYMASENARSRHFIGNLFNRNSLFILTFVSLGYSAYQSYFDPQSAFYLLFSRFWELGVGAIIYKFHHKGALVPNAKVAPWVSSVGLILVLIGIFAARHDAFPFPWALVPVLGTGAMIIGAAGSASRKGIITLALTLPPIRYVGLLSYSLYLWHWPVLVLMRWTLGVEGPFNIAVAVVLIAVLSGLSFHFFEQPLRQSRILKRQSSWIVVTGSIVILTAGAMTAHQTFNRPWLFNQSVVSKDPAWKSRTLPKEVLLAPAEGFPLAGKTLFVIGDSHAGAYGAMLKMASKKLGLDFDILTHSGCGLATLKSARSEACQAPIHAFMAEIERRAKPGDMVFLASLRAYRLSDQWGEYDPAVVDTRVFGAAPAAKRKEALEEASALLNHLQERQIKVIIDTPKPTFRAPPFRCMDWFNRSNAVCKPGFSIDRNELQAVSQPVRESLKVLKTRHPGLIVWDPFPILCPEERCDAFRDGKPLFFDGDHLTGYGNILLYPAFEKLLLSLFPVQTSQN